MSKKDGSEVRGDMEETALSVGIAFSTLDAPSALVAPDIKA